MNKDVQQQLLKLVKKNYEEIAADYDRTRRKHSDPLRKEMEKYASKVEKGARILDVGCGNGRLLELLPSEDIDYLGVDSSETLIEISKRRFPQYKFQAIDILELDKLAESHFDHIFSVAVLHHIPGKDLRIKALKQMRGKLAEDGTILVTVWNLWHQKRIRNRIIRFIFLKLWGKNKMDWKDVTFDWHKSGNGTTSKRYYHAFTKRELKHLAKKAGFDSSAVYKDQYNYFLWLKK